MTIVNKLSSVVIVDKSQIVVQAADFTQMESGMCDYKVGGKEWNSGLKGAHVKR